jgi:hypothetical protein
MTPDADFWFFAWSRIYLGIGLPLIFIPITTASYEGLPPSKTDQASALINLARNFGGAMGVSPNRAGATRTISSGTVVRECRIVESFLLR